MSPADVLTKAIERATANGWKPLDTGMPTQVTQWRGHESVEIGVIFPGKKYETMWVRELEGIIFNHDFAKALWPGYVDLGTHKLYETPQPGIPMAERWKVHIQMMVVSSEPLRYMAKVLENE